MPSLTAVKSTVIDNIVGAVKKWINSQDDESLKAFLRHHLRIDPMSMGDLRSKYEVYMGDLEESAYDQLMDKLEEGELVDKIVFGTPRNISRPEIPEGLIGVPMNLPRAERYMYGWKIVDPNPDAPTYDLRIWTRKRILWTKIDSNGSVSLASLPIGPEAGIPTAP